MREKPFLRRSMFSALGITPACAGKTQMFYMSMRRQEDHTRVCGKNLPYLTFQQAELGSPSRVREKRDKIWGGVFKPRITPACAGKTSWFINCHDITWDHTRVCGKNTIVLVGKVRKPGSPPRGREKLHLLS